MKDLNDFVKVSVRSRQGRKPKVALSIFISGLALSASVLGILSGCSASNGNEGVKSEQSGTENSAVEVANNESSITEESAFTEADTFTEEDAEKYKAFLKTLQDKYGKEGIKIDKADIKELATKYYEVQTSINANLVADDMSIKLVSSTSQTASIIEGKMTEPDDNYTKLNDSLEKESKQLKIVHKLILDCKSVEVGKTEKLNVTVTPAEANYVLTYSSSDTSVLTIDSEGVMTGVKEGKATVTVSDINGVTSSITVDVVANGEEVSEYTTESSVVDDNKENGEKVTESSKVEESSKPSDDNGGITANTTAYKTVAVSKITLTKSSATLTVGDTLKLGVTISPSNAINKSYSFTSSNSSVATVDKNGKVVAKKAGKCDIVVKTSNGKTAKCSVTVKAKQNTNTPSQQPTTTPTNPSNNNNTSTTKPTTPPKPTTVAVTGISLNKSSLSLTVGDSATLKATIAPSNATNKSYSFSSSNNSVATVNSSGKVVAKGKGSCTITVKSSNGKTAKCSVTVKAKASTGNNTSGNNGGTSSTGNSGVASIPAGAKSYQTKSYDGKKTYTVYECPEVVKYINEYRKQAGLKEVKWKTLDYMNQRAYDTVYSIPEKAEEVKEYFPEDYEKAFDKNGNYVGEYNYNDWLDATQNTRNAVAYMLGTNAIYHADERQWSASIQKTGGSTFNPSLWISNIKTSPDHWNMLMSSEADAVYCTYGVTTDGYFYVAIS